MKTINDILNTTNRNNSFPSFFCDGETRITDKHLIANKSFNVFTNIDLNLAKEIQVFISVDPNWAKTKINVLTLLYIKMLVSGNTEPHCYPCLIT